LIEYAAAGELLYALCFHFQKPRGHEGLLTLIIIEKGIFWKKVFKLQRQAVFIIYDTVQPKYHDPINVKLC
jgi:hypothetical protein